MRYARTVGIGAIVILVTLSIFIAGCGGSSDNVTSTDNSNTGGSGISVLFFTQPG